MEDLHDLKKKKAHRRKPGGKRKKDKSRSLDTDSSEVGQAIETVAVFAKPPETKQFIETGKETEAGPSTSNDKPQLRPNKVPKAPKNSTQFIIDDHENSAYFFDFEKGVTSQTYERDESSYFEEDFENEYRTTREAEVTEWPQEVIVGKILTLEERVKTLERQLDMYDPKVYMNRLQMRLLYLQDENRRLREFRVRCPIHGKKVRLKTPKSSNFCSPLGKTISSPHIEFEMPNVPAAAEASSSTQ